MKKVEQLEIEENKKSQKKSFLKKYIIYILLSIIIIALLVALILVIVLPESDKNTSTIKPTVTNVLTTTNIKSTTTTIGVTITTGTTESTTAGRNESITTSTNKSITTTPGTIISTSTNIYSLSSRINCIPWIQSIDESILQNECNKNPNCIYQKSNNASIPSCFYDKNSYKLKLIESKETELGDTYLFSDSSKQIRIDFEYLDNEVIRFKVI
jgi:hypothetical protein